MEGKDPLIEMNRRAMNHIWKAVNPKDIKDGKEYITYIATDIPFLYYSGMVDTTRWTRDQWQQAFDDCLGEDGRYWVSYEKMITLGRFRYSKIVNEPFDPLKMRIGRYTVDRLWRVFEASIIPSCSLPKEFLENTFNQMFRKQKKLAEVFENDFKEIKEHGGKVDADDIDAQHPLSVKIGNEFYIDLTKEHLERLKQFLDNYPSPRRKLEASVYDSRLNKLQELADVAKKPQVSSFEAGKDFRETTKKNLKDMLVKASENVTAGRQPTGEVIDVKNMQNKRPTKF